MDLGPSPGVAVALVGISPHPSALEHYSYDLFKGFLHYREFFDEIPDFLDTAYLPIALVDTVAPKVIVTNIEV